MASQGPNSPATGADDSGVGTQAWTDPSNITADDGFLATAQDFDGPNGVTSHYLKATDFGFSIPSGATIDGIVVEIKKQTHSSFPGKDAAVRIVKGGTIGSTDKSNGSDWPTAELTYVTHGSSSDLWGETWTDSDINGSTFGVAVAAVENNASDILYVFVDHIRITVYYTEAATGQPAVKRMGGVGFAAHGGYQHGTGRMVW